MIPGRVRAVIAFGIVGPLAALLLLGWKSILEEDILSIVTGWLFLAGLSMAVGYFLLLLGRLLLWVQQGFEMSTRTESTRALLRVLQCLALLAMVFVAALYTRYDVVALMDQAEDGYRYLVWDRWSGEMSLEYRELKPSIRRFRRL